jgi:hypothetical protein
LARAEAVEVAKREHRDFVGARDWAPLNLRGGERVLAYVGPNEARIDLGDGKGRALVRSTLPLRAKSASGDLAPVDLGLEDRGESFSPTNPLVATSIAKRLGDGFSLSDIGLRMIPAGGDADAQAGLVSGKPFWSNVDTDTDFFAHVLPGGVEALWQLRSEDSPERLRVRVSLPEGASLRNGDAPGVVEVVRGDAVLATVSRPAARDADGESVPVTQRIEGDSIVVAIDHRRGDWAYPIAVDPEYTEDFRYWAFNPWGGNQDWLDFDGWQFYTSNGGSYIGYPKNPSACLNQAAWCDGRYGRGLYNEQIAPAQGDPYGWRWFNAGDWAEWIFRAPGDTNIYRTEFYDRNDPPYDDPYDYSVCTAEGTWSPQSWAWEGGGQERCGYYNGNYKVQCAAWWDCNPYGGAPGNIAVYQINVRSAGYRQYFTDYLRGSAVFIHDGKPSAPGQSRTPTSPPAGSRTSPTPSPRQRQTPGSGSSTSTCSSATRASRGTATSSTSATPCAGIATGGAPTTPQPAATTGTSTANPNGRPRA